MSHQIVILAAGKGTRMGVSMPKVLVPLHGKPLIQHVLNTADKISKEHAPIIVVGYKNEDVKNAIGSKYLYALQEFQNGTADAVFASKDFVTAENIIVLCGDMPLIKSDSLKKLISLHNQNHSTVSMLTGEIPGFFGHYINFQSFGRIVRNSKGEIIKIVEYSDANEDQKGITEVNPGVYMFNAEWLWKHMQHISNSNAQDEFYLTDIIEVAINNGKHISSLVITPGEMLGVNTPDQLSYAHQIYDELKVTTI